MRSTKTWSPISSVFSMELDGMTKACRVKVMMKSPVTSTAAIEAMNSGVVSLGFVGGASCAGSTGTDLPAFSLDPKIVDLLVVSLRRELLRNPEHAVPAQASERVNGTVSQSRKFTRPSNFSGFRGCLIH